MFKQLASDAITPATHDPYRRIYLSVVRRTQQIPPAEHNRLYGITVVGNLQFYRRKLMHLYGNFCSNF
jgi:hypothetical protein